MRIYLAVVLIVGIHYAEGKCFVSICAGNPSNALRGVDNFGSGAYNAPRGSRLHKGIDIKCATNAAVYTPFPAKVIRLARPYGNGKPHDSGILMEGTGSWAGYSVKMFYFTKTIGNGVNINAGHRIGTMVDMAAQFGSGMTNHIHVQLKKNGFIINPTTYVC